jgi:formamidopyrimidine-DNA glycosylase
MPELPEVETCKRGLLPLIKGQIVSKISIYFPTLRWEIPPHLSHSLNQQTILDIRRRGKYLLLDFKIGVLIIHLGMSGSIRVLKSGTPLKKHDHFEIFLKNKKSLRLNDPRRFGCVLFSQDGTHKLLDSLGVEPLEENFTDTYLYEKSRSKTQNIKGFIMDGKIVVGVGNIYACESLFQAKIDPITPAKNITKSQYKTLTKIIKKTLFEAIKQGGSTLQDFSKVGGSPGYFTQFLAVYARENKSCTQCDAKIARIIQNQRATFYCPICQTRKPQKIF